MNDILFNCPLCNASLKVEAEGTGLKVPCPECGKEITIPTPKPIEATTEPSPPKQEKKIVNTISDISSKVGDKIDDTIKPFINEKQNPEQLRKIYSKVLTILTSEESIKYIAVQTPMTNLFPDAIVLTNRRFVLFRPKLFGRTDFIDYIWRVLSDIQLKEGIFASTLIFKMTEGKTIHLDWIPKEQARKVYAFAQEMEERVREERRIREMEEKRAAAGGVIIHGNNPSFPSQDKEDPVQKLKQLKEMLDTGLITAGEYEAKRQSILSKM